MQQILVILDKPKHEQIALQRALELAEKADVRLHLVSFVYEPVAALPMLSGSVLNISDQLKSERAKWLEALQQENPLPKGSTAEVAWHHDIPSWVLDYTAANACDLVLKTAQKQFGRGGFGSIDWRLIEHVTVPLWLAVSTHWLKRDKIVAAMDPALDNPLHLELNQRVLKKGAVVAAQLGADFDAVACLPMPDMTVEQGQFREQIASLKQALQKVVDDSGVPCKETHFVVGKPAEEVNRVVDRNKARMIMVGRGVRKGAKGFLLGNTAERILGRANTDVLIVP